MMRKQIYHGRLLLFLLLLACYCGGAAEENLYKILGVSRTATKKEIKSAYRRKALDTHPDKNKGVAPEVAAEAFHKVVHAFEILSDEQSRKRYDRTGQSSDQQNQQQRGGGGSGWSWSFTRSNNYGGGGGPSQQRQQRQRPKLKDRFDVKEAMSRVLHIVSLEQLETVIVDDDDDTLERNLLICFYTPPLEDHVNDEMVYPWPFAAMSAQGIWWEDLLQTTVVRFHRSNTLTEFFQIPNGGQLKTPVFVFGKRGTPFSAASNWSKLETKDRNVFDEWMWTQIQVDVNFVNQHDHPVEIYWIHGRSAKIKSTLQPGASEVHTTMLSHEWWVRDARTDNQKDSHHRGKLTDNSKLISWKILSDEHNQELIIPKLTCFDLSGHCDHWKRHGECKRNRSFMETDCGKTCGYCTSEADEKRAEDKKTKQEAGSDEL